LEERLEAVSNSCQEVQNFAGQIENLRSRVGQIEEHSMSEYKDPCSSSKELKHDGLIQMQLDIIKERLHRVEERLDRKRPGIEIPNPSIDDVWDRLGEVESTCSKLADDSLGAVESLYKKVDGMENRILEGQKCSISRLEENLSLRLDESIDKISRVLRKLVAVQKHLGSRYKSVSPTTVVRSYSPSERQELVDNLYREINFLSSIS
jgi:hypothetical protein